MSYRKILFYLCLSYLFFPSCNPAKYVPAGEYLLIKNKVITDSTIIANEEFDPLLKQKPNRKILGLFRFHLGVYNIGLGGRENSKFRKWLRSIGEEPVVVDSELTLKSKQQLSLFLNKNGFFNAVVTDSIERHKKKAVVKYYIRYNESYKIRTISYATQDTGISPLINYFQQTSLLLPGDRYNEDIIENERERITNDLKDRGYYFFNRNYITFQIDTSLGTNRADIYMYINRQNENVGYTGDDSPKILDHQKYRLRNIYIHTDFAVKDPNASAPGDTTVYNGYYILSSSKKRILRDNILVRNLFIKKNDYYLQRDLDLTYKSLLELNTFKFINLTFTEVPRDESQKEYFLDLKIQLTPTEPQDFTWESEATNTGGNIGIAGSFGYRNKNIFRGAETLELRLKGGLEALPTLGTEERQFLYFFNTYEFGPEGSLVFRKFLLPGFIEKKTSRFANPRTSFVVGYNKQDRPDYTRAVSNFTLSYLWNPTRRQKFIVAFPDINAVRVNLSDEFRRRLETLNDPRLFYAYDTHIISSTHISWVYTDQNLNSTEDFIYFRANGELAIRAFRLSLRPSEFYKVDFDISHHHYINRFNNIVSRLTAGVGIPYGSSTALPFEKSFFGGGANSMRAWNARTLGPGSYSNDIVIEQGGDLKIEMNLEYRSEIVKFVNGVRLEGATFIDAGNIWLRNEDPRRPGGKFEPGNALNEIAIGGGFGLRFNFSFFILRLDAAVKLRDPSLRPEKRWVYPNQKFVIGDVTLNLGIGYPF